MQPGATLKDLGVDSITIVEIGEELGRRFHRYLSDETIDAFVTVQDAIDAVVLHDGATPTSMSVPVPARPIPFITAPAPTPPTARTPPSARMVDRETRPFDDERGKAAGRLAIWMGIAGAALGVVIGMGFAAVIAATGLGASNLPPLSITTPTATTSTPETTKATPTPTDGTPSKEPTMQVSSTSVQPGERFTLEGAFPDLGSGATLQVQVKDPGTGWDDFPVATKTKGDGAYSTQIYTSRTGKREFRMYHKESSKASPSMAVEIG